MNKKTAIILGGTIPHKYLINNLKGRGYYTILVDYLNHPPAADVADEHLVESTLDKEKVLKIAIERKADLVISGCVDQANITACYVSEELGLHVPYSYKTALRVTDKKLMKEGMVNAGIPTAAYDLVTAENLQSYNTTSFPKVVKPADCNGSKGVRKVNTPSELKIAIAEALDYSRTHRAIVEDFKEGTEINIYCCVNQGKPEIIYLKSKTLPNIDKKSALQSFFSLGDFSPNPAVLEKINDTIVRISKEFNLNNTPILIQAIVKDDNIDVIEFAPRVGGGLAFREIYLRSGYNIIDTVIDSFLDQPLESPKKNEEGIYSSVVHFFGTHGILKDVKGLEELKDKNIIKEFHLHKTKGAQMTTEDLASRNRIFGVIVFGNNIQEIKSKLDTLQENVEIINTDNENVFLKVSFEELNELSHKII